MTPEPILTFLLICCSSFIGPRIGIYDGELNYCPPTVQIRSASVFGIFDIFHNRIRLEYIRNELNWK